MTGSCGEGPVRGTEGDHGADLKRGRYATPDDHNLRVRFKTYETEMLRFADDPDVSFTNNRAERDLRMSKVKQKVSGCFRTRTYAPAWYRISNYLQSAAAQGDTCCI